MKEHRQSLILEPKRYMAKFRLNIVYIASFPIYILRRSTLDCEFKFLSRFRCMFPDMPFDDIFEFVLVGIVAGGDQSIAVRVRTVKASAIRRILSIRCEQQAPNGVKNINH